MKKILALLTGITFCISLTVCKASGHTQTQDTETTPKLYGTTYENVEVLKYEDSKMPYLHYVYTNQTNKTIVSVERSMLAFDKDGQPLEISWYMTDSSDTPSYECLYEMELNLPAGQTYAPQGGWSLEENSPVAYALYCDKSILFDDGSIWENPDYTTWIDTWKGQTVEIEHLKGYYPVQFEIQMMISRTASF